MHTLPSRRQLLAAGAALGAASAAAPFLETTVNAQSDPEPPKPQSRSGKRRRPAIEPFGYCLNTSTIRGHNLSIAAEADIPAEAGHEAIAPRIGNVQECADQGRSLNAH